MMMSVSQPRYFTLNSQGRCFVCIKKRNQTVDDNGDQAGNNVISLEALFKRLKIDEGQILGLKMKLPQDILRKANVKVSVCSSCYTLINTYENLETEINKLERRRNALLKIIFSTMGESEKDDSLKKEYQSSMSTDIADVLHFGIIDELRGKVLSQCSQLTRFDSLHESDLLIIKNDNIRTDSNAELRIKSSPGENSNKNEDKDAGIAPQPQPSNPASTVEVKTQSPTSSAAQNNTECASTQPATELQPSSPLTSFPTSEGSINVPYNTVAAWEDMPANELVETCKNFLSHLLNQTSMCKNNIIAVSTRNAVQDLLDGKLSEELFANRLSVKSCPIPKPSMSQFLKKTLPCLKILLQRNQWSLDGIRSPGFTTAPSSVPTDTNTPRQPPLAKPANTMDSSSTEKKSLKQKQQSMSNPTILTSTAVTTVVQKRGRPRKSPPPQPLSKRTRKMTPAEIDTDGNNLSAGNKIVCIPSRLNNHLQTIASRPSSEPENERSNKVKPGTLFNFNKPKEFDVFEIFGAEAYGIYD